MLLKGNVVFKELMSANRYNLSGLTWRFFFSPQIMLFPVLVRAMAQFVEDSSVCRDLLDW